MTFGIACQIILFRRLECCHRKATVGCIMQFMAKSCHTEKQFRLSLATHLVNKTPLNERVIRLTGTLLCICDKDFILTTRQRERKWGSWSSDDQKVRRAICCIYLFFWRVSHLPSLFAFSYPAHYRLFAFWVSYRDKSQSAYLLNFFFWSSIRGRFIVSIARFTGAGEQMSDFELQFSI